MDLQYRRNCKKIGWRGGPWILIELLAASYHYGNLKLGTNSLANIFAHSRILTLSTEESAKKSAGEMVPGFKMNL
jgi:hypothetical protein